MKIFAEKGLFWWFENLKNQNLSLLTQLWCPLGSHCNCDWQGCDICNKNLNPRAFGFYQKCQSKIWKSSEGGGEHIFLHHKVPCQKEAQEFLDEGCLMIMGNGLCVTVYHILLFYYSTAHENVSFCFTVAVSLKGVIFCPSIIFTLYPSNIWGKGCSMVGL